MGEIFDFESAKKHRDERRGLRPKGVIDRLAQALGIGHGEVRVGSSEDLDRVASSAEVDEDVRDTAKAISSLLHGEVHEIVEEQKDKEE